jgi:allantoinase
MQASDFIIRSRRVVTSRATRPASVVVRRGVIERVGEYADLVSNLDLIDAGDAVIMPGLVDSHVHINEPGRTEWEGFDTAGHAAAAGGVTVLVDMPLNSIPPTTTVDNFKAKMDAARGRSHVDLAFWGGAVPDNTDDLEPLASAGVVGFKCFLVDSGVEEFPRLTENDLQRVMPELSRLGAVLAVHAELPEPIDEAAYSLEREPSDPQRFDTFLASRPNLAEDAAVRLMIKLASRYGNKIHIVHLSSAGSLPDIRAAKAAGTTITAETCPHYLTFAAEEIPDRSTEFKCCPPIRDRENRRMLWEGLREGTLAMVVSDHSPCKPELKTREKGDFMQAWGGIASLQLRLPAVWSVAREKGTPFEVFAEWLCSAPARLVGLGARKGKIAPGFDADFVVWHPEETFTVTEDALYHRHKLTPYLGRTLAGVVQSTYLRGERVFHHGVVTDRPHGEFLLRDK